MYTYILYIKVYTYIWKYLYTEKRESKRFVSTIEEVKIEGNQTETFSLIITKRHEKEKGKELAHCMMHCHLIPFQHTT